MVCLHATDPSTVYLSAWARVDGMAVPDMERALYVDRSLVKHLAMRRTLFVFPRATLSVAQAGASDRVADGERRRLDPRRREGRAAAERRALARRRPSEQVLAALSDGREATSSELRDEIPALEGSIAYGEGKSWGGQVPVGPRVLTTLSAAGRIVRASNDGGWTTSRPRWASTTSWLGEEIAPLPGRRGRGGAGRAMAARVRPRDGRRHQVVARIDGRGGRGRRSPTSTRSRSISDGQTGYVLPDDLEPTAPVEPWAALLPPLDPTTMGWFERDWYLGPLQGAAVRHERQRRTHRVVERPDRGRLAPDRDRRGRTPAARGRRQGGATCPRGRGDAPDRVARRNTRGREVPVTVIEAARSYRAVIRRRLSRGPATGRRRPRCPRRRPASTTPARSRR